MSSTVTMAAYGDALIAELSLAFELVLGGSVVATSGPPAQSDGWAATFTAAGDLVGTITAWMDRAGSALLAQRVTSTDAPDDAVVADMLKEMWSQAAGALSVKAPFTGVRLTLDGSPLPAAGDRQLAAYTIAFAADGSAQVAVSGAVRAAELTTAAAPPARASEIHARQAPPAAAAPNLDVVLDIDLPLIVRFGRTLMTLKTLAALGPGSILDMGRSPDEPVEILVGEQVIARGEVVIAGGNYGVRITDLVSPSDRIKALEG